MNEIAEYMKACGFELAHLGGNCTGWQRSAGTRAAPVLIQVSHVEMDAFADPYSDCDWIAGAHAVDGSCVFTQMGTTLVGAVKFSQSFPTDPKDFESFAKSKGLEFWPAPKI